MFLPLFKISYHFNIWVKPSNLTKTVDIVNIQEHSLKMEVEMSKKASKTSVWSKAKNNQNAFSAVPGTNLLNHMSQA